MDTKYIKLYDLEYQEGRHYYVASRNPAEKLTAIKTGEEFRGMRPDAVSCVVVIELPDEEPRMLLTYEYRYPAGRFLLGIPAGLIDEDDGTDRDQAIRMSAVREIHEETGVEVKPEDTLKIVNPLLFCTPGMTDESNALVCAVVHLENLDSLNQDGAVGTECFDGFRLVTAAEAEKILENGCDEHGNFYALVTWAALMYFVTGHWKR